MSLRGVPMRGAAFAKRLQDTQSNDDAMELVDPSGQTLPEAGLICN